MAFGDVIREASSPSTSAFGLGGDASTIWHCDANARDVYELSTTDFSVVRFANSPATYPFGIGGDASVIWHCGSKRLFVEEALKHDMNLEGLGGKTPILFSFEYAYETVKGPVRLMAIGDACFDCGLPRIVVMDKVELKPKPTLHLPPGAGRG